MRNAVGYCCPQGLVQGDQPEVEPQIEQHSKDVDPVQLPKAALGSKQRAKNIYATHRDETHDDPTQDIARIHTSRGIQSHHDVFPEYNGAHHQTDGSTPDDLDTQMRQRLHILPQFEQFGVHRHQQTRKKVANHIAGFQQSKSRSVNIGLFATIHQHALHQRCVDAGVHVHQNEGERKWHSRLDDGQHPQPVEPQGNRPGMVTHNGKRHQRSRAKTQQLHIDKPLDVEIAPVVVPHPQRYAQKQDHHQPINHRYQTVYPVQAQPGNVGAKIHHHRIEHLTQGHAQHDARILPQVTRKYPHQHEYQRIYQRQQPLGEQKCTEVLGQQVWMLRDVAGIVILDAKIGNDVENQGQIQDAEVDAVQIFGYHILHHPLHAKQVGRLDHQIDEQQKKEVGQEFTLHASAAGALICGAKLGERS